MKYRLIAIDLDGTLLCPQGQVSEENRAALHTAHDAGVVILPCTGRGWRESGSVLGSIPDAELGVFNTGGLVHDLHGGSTVDRAVFDPAVARELIELIRPMPEAVLVYTDPAGTGLEYVITGDGRPTDNSLWWFKQNGLRFAEQPTMHAELLEHVVRVGVVARTDRALAIEKQIVTNFLGRIEVHGFEAVQMPDPAESMHIVEAFPKGVTKWRGIEFVAQRHGIALDQVAVIGDQINDLPMFVEAACAVAMGNAIGKIKDAAHFHTHTNADHGVAHAIGQMLCGAW